MKLALNWRFQKWLIWFVSFTATKWTCGFSNSSQSPCQIGHWNVEDNDRCIPREIHWVLWAACPNLQKNMDTYWTKQLKQLLACQSAYCVRTDCLVTLTVIILFCWVNLSHGDFRVKVLSRTVKSLVLWYRKLFENCVTQKLRWYGKIILVVRKIFQFEVSIRILSTVATSFKIHINRFGEYQNNVHSRSNQIF